MSAIRLMFAMRSEFFRESFARLLQGDTGLQVIISGGCTFADEVEEMYEQLQPDILIMDFKLYRGSSLEVMETILHKSGSARIIGVSESYKQDIADSLQEIGAHGYLLRNDDIRVMKDIITNVYKGLRMINHHAMVKDA